MQFNIIAGPTRTGTTSLFRSLIKSADVSGSKVKETNFFLQDYKGEGTVLISEYLKLFSKTEENNNFLEASPKYFGWSKDTSNRIGKLLAAHNVKIAIILREPVERLESVFAHILTKRSIQKYSSVSALLSMQEREITSIKRDSHVDKLALLEGAYLHNIKCWIEEFGAKNVSIFFFDNATDNSYVENVANFFELKTRNLQVLHENSTRHPKHVGLHKVALRINSRLEPLFNRFPQLRQSIRKLYYAVNEKAKSNSTNLLSDREIIEIKDYYKNINRGLYSYCYALDILQGKVPNWFRETM